MTSTFVDCFLDNAHRFSHKTALCFEEKSITYAALADRSAQVASKLRAAGIGQGDAVTIRMNRGIDAVCAMLGILRAGAAFCVISSDYPEDRAQYIIKDTAAKVTIDSAWMENLSETTKALPLPKPQDAALIVYTSGSTGNPKGVCHNHRTLLQAVRNHAALHTQEDIFLSVTSFSFIVITMSLFAPLYAGATVHILNDETRTDGMQIAKYIHDHGVTAGFLPPQLARIVLPLCEDQLISLSVGSERVYGLYSDKVKITNHYGSSETCGSMAHFKVDRLYSDNTPIGVPEEGCGVYVLDDDLNRVPDGETGEICVGGQTAMEYINLPELTAERFVKNPFAAGEEDDVLYRTGDIGRMNEQGQLEYVQRKDWMIKVRGFRVEPGEIEQTMMARAPIEQAVVTGFENAVGETSLYAVYTAKEQVDPMQVLDAIRGFLPPYMIPAFVEQLDALPVNQNGKIARKEIVAPDAARFRVAYEAPKNEREAAICEAFAKVLKLERVGALDDFNLLGGDSMMAAGLQTELPGISASDILTRGTPRALAALDAGSTLTKAEPRENWPLTFAERQMAIEQGMNPDTVEYNVNLAFHIDGALDEVRLQAALDDLLDCHVILRSVYPLEKGEYVHRIVDGVGVPIARIDCAKQAAAQRIAALNLPFELGKAPLLRCHLLVHGENSYTLHFCLHHIIIDGGCVDTLIGDLMKLYQGETLPEIKLDFLDFSIWQQEHGDLRGGEAFFKEMFAGGVPENEMPTLPSRPDVLPVADIDIERTVKAADIKAASQRLGVTTYGLLMSVLGMTLGKYCASEDVVVGTAMSGRILPEQKGMMGMFVNTLPLRLKPVGDMRIRDYVLKVAKTIRTVKANQSYPFERLVPMLAPDRNASRSPVFDIIFNYLQEMALPTVEGLEVSRMHLKGQALSIDLMLEAICEGDDIRLVLSYSRELYMDEVVENFMEQFVTTLMRIVEERAELVMDACALPEKQLRQIVDDFPGKRTYHEGTVVDSFRAQVKRTPDRCAVTFGEEVLTYAQLDDVTDRLAGYLTMQGIGRGSVVGILVHRGLMMPVGALGALKAGAAYLPLDPAYPTERLEFMLEDAGASVTLCDETLVEKIPDFIGEILDTRMVWTLEASRPSGAPTKEDLFILLYTSGTTGKPKGVMLEHGGIANFMNFYADFHHIAERDEIPAYASFGFDANMMDMYPTLMRGAGLHIIPEEMRLDLPGLRDYFDAHKITVAFMTTQLGRQFADTMDCPSMRALCVGGEALVPIEPPRFTLYNFYGPSECSVVSNFFKVDRLYDRVPIGKPTDNTAVYVVDSRGRLCPVGVAGEMCIAGVQVGRGYLNRPDLTSEKFIPNPFTDDPAYARMYKTGDVVRFLPTGDIDFVGRRDFQVKIRGFRIELTEIEGRIRAFPGINDATVIAQDDAGGGKRIVAYITSDTSVDIKAMNAFIEEELPAYMVPSATMQIDAIPLNQNGKVDKRRLPKITIAAEEIVPPKTEFERLIIEAVAGILGVDEIGITTDLMYAGLNSLSAIKAAALITEKTGKKLTTAQLMRERTPEKIAALLSDGEDYVEYTYEKRDAYPLTDNQMGLYFACIKEPASIVYNIPVALHAKNVDAERLKDSILQVIAAHPYIKTRIELRRGMPVQLRMDDAPVEIPIIDCTKEAYDDRRAAFVRPFSFFDGPLYRIEILRMTDGVTVLCDFHHIVFDGGSMDVFLDDLSKAYDGRVPAPERFTSFDMALAEQEGKDSDAQARDKAYYHERLSDGEGATQIPKDGDSMGTLRIVSQFVQKNELEAVLRGMRITASNLFLAATALVTGRFASTSSVRIATITNGREGAQWQRNLGMLVKTLPVVIDTKGEQTGEGYLKKVQDEMTAVMEHLGYTYMQASAEYGFQAQMLYAYQGGVVSAYTLGSSPLVLEELGLERAKFPVSIEIQESGDNFIVQSRYDDGVFEAATMQRLCDCIAHMARQLAAKAQDAIGTMSILTKEQAAQISSFNRPITPVRTRSLNLLFEEWAQRTPDNTALIACDGTYTFRQLNERANVLAHALLARGVSRSDRIAFMLHRDSRILIAMLGIMKAGACYIPVDPDYPDERISHVLEDSGALFILTDGTRSVDNGIFIDELLTGSELKNPDVNIHPDDLAYIIYTSGSTGKPKGVMLTHRGIINYVRDTELNRHVHALVAHSCVMASVTTVSFDMFLKEAFTTLMNGLTLVLADDEQAKNPDKLAELMLKTHATSFNATPSRMLQYMLLPQMRTALSRCKVIMAGGEGYPPVLYQKLRDITDATLINTYGPTEITVSSNGKILDSERITIGAPLENVLELVMDIEGNPLPVGVTGELWIGGTGVARGYFNNEAMTAERFVEKYGVRWYKSGDLTRFTENGEIIVLGRNDGQIKLRGLRIELGEIENSIAAIEEITSSVVLVRKLNSVEHLCAYYTATRPLPAQELRERLMKNLTKYMVPTAYLQMDALPMTPNGKIDRRALPDAQMMQREEYEAPMNEKEAAYCDIFSEILHLESISATDNFFDLGGSSLLVTQLTIGALEHGFALSYGDVFANPTPRALAALGTSEKKLVPKDDILDYDYAPLHELLKENNLDALRSGEYRPLGNICITGATGFLGIHVLYTYLNMEAGTAYCVVRGGKQDAVKRLKGMLAYYFTEDFEGFFGNRIVVVDSDITSRKLFDQLMCYPIDTYINCAANVKHFSAGTDIEDINYGGVVNGLAFAKEKGCRFVQVSTTSVAGMSIDGEPGDNIRMDEQMLYFGQDLSNKYTHSKFLAERAVLEAALKGQDVKIMRVGNLMARDSDGEFQINFKTNNFLGTLKAYYIVGCIPYEAMGSNCKFAPIDATAEAILLLATTPKECRVFHPYNDHDVFMGDVVRVLERIGISIKPCEMCEYKKASSEALRDSRKAAHLNSLIAYQEHGKHVTAIKSVNSFTSQALMRQGFMWRITTPYYMTNFFKSMKELGFFDMDGTLKESQQQNFRLPVMTPYFVQKLSQMIKNFEDFDHELFEGW